MLQEIEQVSPTMRRLKINVPSEVVQSETDSLYNEIRATTRIPGFRPGKAPQAILVRKFGKKVEAQVIEKIVPRFYLEAVKEAKIEPVTYPDIDNAIELKAGQPLFFSVTVEVKPDIGEIGYGSIPLKKKTAPVEDSEVEKALSSLRESKAVYSVTEDPLAQGDMAIVDTKAFIEGEPSEELSYREYPLMLGSQEMPGEFTSALTGRKKGDTVDVAIHFEADHPNRSIAGKDVIFKVTVTEAKKKNLPPLDDEFAKEAECGSLDELKKKIHGGIRERKESQINLDYKREILDDLVKRHDFDVPPSMLSGEIESLVEHEKEAAMRKGAEVKPDEELKKEFAARARDNVKSVLLLEAIGKKENISIGDEDVRKAIAEIAARNSLKPEEVTRLYSVREGSMDALKSRLFADKVLDFILEKASVQ